MTHETLHLTTERIQALVDGQLPEGDAARAREHVDGCARCRAQLEAWTEMFDALEGLPRLTPSPDFSARVLGALPSREAALPWAARVRAWLGSRLAPAPTAAVHPAQGRLQDLLDGRLSGRRAVAVERHLGVCRTCRHEMEGLARVVSAVERLPRHAPSDGFGDRVMAAVRVPEPATALARLRRVATSRVREVLSLRTRRAWAAVAGVAFTPLVVAAMVGWVVFSHPLVTLGSLMSFLWIQGSDLAAAAGAWATAGVLESPLLFRAWAALEGVWEAPAMAAGGFLAFSALTLVAVWVLYSNLSVPRAAEVR